MIRISTPAEIRRRALCAWLLVMAALVFATVLVGGATRLTGSGLSITEWRPVTGALPPLSEAAWAAEFEKYKTIPQYQSLNRGMRLQDFKTIYWWEWTHRFLGRFVGAAFLLPFLWFLWRGWIAPRWRATLWAIFALGAMQGAVGWWMVASGLAERTSVSQYRLAFHLTLACVIYAALVWTMQRLVPKAIADDAPARLRWSARALLVLVFAQIYIGALVAGLKAGLVYNTWPTIDGALVPAAERLWFLSPAWRNLFENELTVQFSHRMVACIIWTAAVLHAADASRGGQGNRLALALAGAVTLQAAVGVVTLLNQAPIALALLHQAMAMIVLTIAVLHVDGLTSRPAETASPTPALCPYPDHLSEAGSRRTPAPELPR